MKHDRSRLRAVVESEVRREHDVHRIVGSGPAMQQLMETARAVAQQDTSTLILGESGTGKELLARAIHDMSGRKSGPYVRPRKLARHAAIELKDRWMDALGELPPDKQEQFAKQVSELADRVQVRWTPAAPDRQAAIKVTPGD